MTQVAAKLPSLLILFLCSSVENGFPDLFNHTSSNRTDLLPEDSERQLANRTTTVTLDKLHLVPSNPAQHENAAVYLGMGYDVFRGTPGYEYWDDLGWTSKAIFQKTPSSADNGGRWCLEEARCRAILPPRTVTKSIRIQERKDFQNHLARNFHLISFSTINITAAMGLHSIELQDIQESLVKGNTVVDQKISTLYDEADLLPFPELHSQFLRSLCLLPLHYNLQQYITFLKDFGTHFIVKVRTGSLLHQRIFDEQSTQSKANGSSSRSFEDQKLADLQREYQREKNRLSLNQPIIIWLKELHEAFPVRLEQNASETSCNVSETNMNVLRTNLKQGLVDYFLEAAPNLCVSPTPSPELSTLKTTENSITEVQEDAVITSELISVPESSTAIAVEPLISEPPALQKITWDIKSFRPVHTSCVNVVCFAVDNGSFHSGPIAASSTIPRTPTTERSSPVPTAATTSPSTKRSTLRTTKSTTLKLLTIPPRTTARLSPTTGITANPAPTTSTVSTLCPPASTEVSVVVHALCRELLADAAETESPSATGSLPFSGTDSVTSTNNVPQSFSQVQETVVYGRSFLDDLPKFRSLPMTNEDCRALRTINCAVTCTTSLLYVICTPVTPQFGHAYLLTPVEIRDLFSKIRNQGKNYPIRVRLPFGSFDHLTDDLFVDVRQNVVHLEIWRPDELQPELSFVPTDRYKSRTFPVLPNLLILDCWNVDNINILKSEFSKLTNLRGLLFQRSTVNLIERGALEGLKKLQRLVLDAFARDTDRVIPMKVTLQTAHLVRFHCDCEYSWLRDWLKNSDLISEKGRILYRYGASAFSWNGQFYSFACENVSAKSGLNC